MAKLKLPSREQEICERFRFARDQVLKITQAACAAGIGVERNVVVNYEIGRTALRYDLALRFCRQFIISEEWLATGRHDSFHAVLIQQGAYKKNASESWGVFDDKISIRQAVDLWSEPLVLHIKTGTLFSMAFDEILQKKYAELVADCLFSPRISFSDADTQELGINFLRALYEQHVSVLMNEASRHQIKQSDMWRNYVAYLLECSVLVFLKMKGSKLTPDLSSQYNWLRGVLADPAMLIEPLASVAGPEELQKNILPYVSESVNVENVKAKLPSLLKRLDIATAQRGKKSELAKFLGVSLVQVSQWLTGDREPGGETTLRLLQWVEQQEQK